MRSVHRRQTKPEMVVRRALHASGYRFRANVTGLPGSPDIVFTARRKAIFVHGCFWHRHPGCRLTSLPKTNVDFWQEKFVRNVERDARKVLKLEANGWRTLTVWECETRTMDATLPNLIEFLGPPRMSQKIIRSDTVPLKRLNAPSR